MPFKTPLPDARPSELVDVVRRRTEQTRYIQSLAERPTGVDLLRVLAVASDRDE